ncbi:hypothetical protein OAE19_05360 [Porticoccaceae bacterium]|nr:hypothetical protein [Porticoccaceae bacterium]
MAQFLAYNTPPGADRISTLATIHPAELARVRSLYNPPGSVPVSVVGDNIHKTEKRCKDYRPRRMVQKPASHSASYGDDFYHRIYILPRIINMGSIASQQERTFNVWNAFLTTKTLTQITESGTDGLSISAPASGSFQPLQWQPYTLTVSEEGPSDVSGIYEFDFGTDTPQLLVTGTRIIIMPFIALNKIEESLQWRTDVMKAFGQESRRGVRSSPRQGIDYSVHVQATERQRLEKLLEKQTTAFGVPVWWEQQSVGAISLGATQINLDTTSSDFRVGGLVFIWDDNNNFEAVEVATIDPTDITLNGSIKANYSNPLVMPMRVGYLRGASMDRMHRDNNIANIKFVMREYAAIAAGTFPQHEGDDVLLDASVNTRSKKITISMNRQWLDNGIGAVTPYANEDRVRVVDSQEWIRKGTAQKWLLRQWLFARAGQRNSFYVPTFQNDYVLLQTISDVATSIIVGPTDEAAPIDIYIQLKDGTQFTRRITGIVPNPSLPQEQWTFAGALGQEVLVSDIRLLSRMRHMRQSSDEIKLSHSMPHLTHVTVPLTTV